MQNTYGRYEQKPPTNPQKIRPHPNNTQCNLGNTNGCVLLLFAAMILTDGIRLTTTGYIRNLHKVAQQAGIKRKEYASKAYQIQSHQVNVVLALGANIVSTPELEEIITNKTRCKN